jgi:regulator of replication initiation timing
MDKECVTHLQEQIRILQDQLDLIVEENKLLKKANEQLVSTLEKEDPPVITTEVEDIDDEKIPWGSGEVGWGKY